MTRTLDRRRLCRNLFGRVMDQAASLAAIPDGSAEDDQPAGVPDYFSSFAQCHTLIAEMRPFMADALADLEIDPAGKTDVELAREIMAHDRAAAARFARPDDSMTASDPADGGASVKER